MRDHRFRIGVTVRLKNRAYISPGAAETYRITAKLPLTSNWPQYRIRNDELGQERVSGEDNLGSPLAIGVKPEEAHTMSKDEEHALALSIWESEGGAPDGSRQLYQYGRRFEGDGTYAIHHVFTGETVRIGLWTMAGLNPKNAARALRVLNTLQIT
jgi:hypothetical protein